MARVSSRASSHPAACTRGNYYGALHQFIRLQSEGEALYFIANLHALSTVRDGRTLRENTFEAALACLSLGLDPTTAILFRQSDVPEITELFWILASLAIRTDSTACELPPIDGALYRLLALIAPPDEFVQLDVSWRAGGKGYAEYKKLLLEYFHASFDGARRRGEELRRHPSEVERILVDGARRARDIAAPIMAQVRLAPGIR